jgi:hypothetical protein
MDFNKWVAGESGKHDLTADEWDQVRKTEIGILTFVREDSGRIKASHKGIVVFRHRDFEDIIMPGQTWICSLDKKATNYFAKGIVRVDSAFLFELKKDQIEEIASYLWEKQRHIIEPILDERYKDITNKKIAQVAEETGQKYETEMKQLKDTIHDLEKKDAENKNMISSLHEKLDAAKKDKSPKTGKTEIAGPAGIVTASVSVRRDGPDSISSDSFDKSRYSVHLSADHRIIIVRPHNEGSVVCLDNTIVLAGLSMISPFNGPRDMVSEYNHVYGGIQIYL